MASPCILPFGLNPATFAPGAMDPFGALALSYLDPSWFTSAAAALAAAGHSQSQPALSVGSEAKPAAQLSDYDSIFRDLLSVEGMASVAQDSSEGTSELSSPPSNTLSERSGKIATTRSSYGRRSSSSRPVAMLPEAELHARRKKEREAKARSRQRQRERISSLERANQDLESDNAQLEEKLRSLQAELSYLKHVLSLVEAKGDKAKLGGLDEVALAAVSAGSTSPAPAVVPGDVAVAPAMECI